MKCLSGGWQDPVGQYLAACFTQQTGVCFYTAYTAIGYVTDRYQGVAVFTDFTGSNIELHYVGKVLTRAIMRSIGNYVFNQLKCNRLTVKTRASSSYVTDYYTRIGFEYECTLKDYYGLGTVEDAIAYVMTRKQASKWIKVDG